MRRNQNFRILDLPDERLHSVLILFATYAVLVNGTAGGPTGKTFSNCRSFWLKLSCCCSAPYLWHGGYRHVQKQQKPGDLLLALTWLFGAGFIGMEIYEFHT